MKLGSKLKMMISLCAVVLLIAISIPFYIKYKSNLEIKKNLKQVISDVQKDYDVTNLYSPHQLKAFSSYFTDIYANYNNSKDVEIAGYKDNVCAYGTYSNISIVKVNNNKECLKKIQTQTVNNCVSGMNLSPGTVYVNGQYEYHYKKEFKGKNWYDTDTDGWSIILTSSALDDDVIDTKMCTSVDGKPIISMNFTFMQSQASTIDLSSFNTSNVTSMFGTFLATNKVKNLDLSNFDTSKVTDMSGMFEMNYEGEYDGSNLQNLYLGNFDTSNVTDMSFMFDCCNSLESLDVSSFDTSKVTDMTAMFQNDSSLTTINLKYFNTSKVTNMPYMFSRCFELESLDLSDFDTSNVNSMEGMFSYSGIKHLNVGSFNTSNVTTMEYMFDSDDYLQELDLSNFDTSKVTNMAYMFNGCSWLTAINLSNFDTSNVTDMSYMFTTTTFKELDLSNFDTSQVTDMREMFYFTNQLTSVLVSKDKWVISPNTNTDEMFSYSGVTSVTYK